MRPGGILRDGELVDLGTLAQLRHLSALSVEATFDGSVPDLSGIPGVSAVAVTGRTMRCQVHGSVESLLRVLADAGVHGLLSREPSLEELFLAHHGPGAWPRTWRAGVTRDGRVGPAAGLPGPAGRPGADGLAAR